MVTTHVFIAVSLDGYIARQDDDIDWLLQRDDPTEDHGYAAFIADKDWIVMGRGSYEKALTFDQWPYDRPVLVLSRQLTATAVPEALKDKVQFSSRTPGEVLADLTVQNAHRVYIDGGKVIQSFLREGLVADMIITTVPVLLGSGKPLFGSLTRDIDLTLLKGICCQKERVVLELGSLDLVDGTPVVDIKPYLPFAEALPEASASYAQQAPQAEIAVSFTSETEAQLFALEKRYPRLKAFIREVLAQDPRPAYRKEEDPGKTYAVWLLDFNVRWRVISSGFEVFSLEPR